jgi:hypothetical protein
VTSFQNALSLSFAGIVDAAAGAELGAFWAARTGATSRSGAMSRTARLTNDMRAS